MQYQVFDVTRLLRTGRNTLVATLAPGWYAGRIGLLGDKNHYGQCLRFRARLYADETPVVHTDGHWEYADRLPIASADILDGEHHDARVKPVWKPAIADSWPSSGPLVAQPNEPVRVTQELRPVSRPASRANVVASASSFATPKS